MFIYIGQFLSQAVSGFGFSHGLLIEKMQMQVHTFLVVYGLEIVDMQ